MKHRITWIISLACCAGLLTMAWGAIPNHSVAKAQDPAFYCSYGAVAGKYGYHMSGNIAGVGPFALVGGFEQTSDGRISGQTPIGKITGQVTASFNGQIVKNFSFEGTFRFTADCFGTGSLRAVNGQIFTYDFQVVDRGRQILLINTDPGSTFNGVATRID